MKITQFIQTGNFNSRVKGMILLDIDITSPKEKSITEDVPHSDGLQDYSMIFGERKLGNRKHAYKFLYPGQPLAKRNSIEKSIRRELLTQGNQPLYDSYIPGFYWLGKVEDVKAKHDEEYNELVVTVIFDLYPYMFTNKAWFDDVWDDFDLNNGVANYTKYAINGELDIVLFNTGDKTIAPVITVEER